MVKKINRLIIASILGLISLSVIQGYLIRNTYILKKESFENKVSGVVSKIDDYTPEIDSINGVWQSLLVKSLDRYKAKITTKEDLLKRLRKVTDSLNTSFVKAYNRELATKNLKYELKFHKTLKRIVLLDSIQNDTIFKENKIDPYRLLGDNFDHKGEHQISNSLWHTERTTTLVDKGKEKTVSYVLNFETQDYMNIEGWRSIIFNSMRILLLLSFVIFVFVIGVLYYSIKNLITQKRIADVQTDFVNNITHELKTPLATLSLATKILKKDTAIVKSNTSEMLVSTIERQNKRLQNLIDQVLNNSLGYTEIQLRKENINIKKYLDIFLDDFLLPIDEKKVKIVRDINTENKEICIDVFFFTTALLNILENAVKYSNDSVCINFIVSCDESYKIVIKDNGIGISSKDRNMVFDKFFRAGNKEVHDVKGLGLGLYYTKQIIKAHEGTIEVVSIKNKGTTFEINIPLEKYTIL